MRDADEEPETAPPEEFLVAGLVLLAFVLMAAAVFVRSPLMLAMGMGTLAVSGIGFGLYRLYQVLTGKRRRRQTAYEGPSMMGFLLGGFWRGRR